MAFNALVAESGNEEWALIANGIRRWCPESSILRVKDGEQALRFLFKRGLFADEPEVPDLVVLSTTLASVPFEDIVARMRQHPRTLATPIIVVGTDAPAEEEAQERDGQRVWQVNDRCFFIVRTPTLDRDVADSIRALCEEVRAD